jgi:hypothetical protein
VKGQSQASSSTGLRLLRVAAQCFGASSRWRSLGQYGNTRKTSSRYCWGSIRRKPKGRAVPNRQSRYLLGCSSAEGSVRFRQSRHAGTPDPHISMKAALDEGSARFAPSPIGRRGTQRCRQNDHHRAGPRTRVGTRERLRRPTLLLRLLDGLSQRFEQRRHALDAAERRGDRLVHDDALERSSSLLEILALRDAASARAQRKRAAQTTSAGSGSKGGS